jgi:hypothetical protein
MRVRITLALALLAASIGMLIYAFAASENYSIHNYSLVVCCLLPVASPLIALGGLWILGRECNLRRTRVARIANDPPQV